MATPFALDREEVRAILSLYHLEGPEDFGDVGASKPAYWVTAAGRKFFLRVTEDRRIDDMIFEKDVLTHLVRHDLPVPGLVPNVARGTFTPWAARGRYVSLFEYVPGRRLGLFEVRPKHTLRIGQLCARLHRALGTFGRRRPHGPGLEAAESLLGRLEHAAQRRRLPKRHHPHLSTFSQTIERQRAVKRLGAPSGVVHGDLGLSSLRFERGRPSGVVGFERAGVQRWTWDLACALHAWTWAPDPSPGGGPRGRFDPELTRSLLRAYDRMRPLSGLERSLLPEDLRLVVAHEGLSRMARYELSRAKKKGPYRDYRHCSARLEALEGGGAERLVQTALR